MAWVVMRDVAMEEGFDGCQMSVAMGVVDLRCWFFFEFEKMGRVFLFSSWRSLFYLKIFLIRSFFQIPISMMRFGLFFEEMSVDDGIGEVGRALRDSLHGEGMMNSGRAWAVAMNAAAHPLCYLFFLIFFNYYY